MKRCIVAIAIVAVIAVLGNWLLFGTHVKQSGDISYYQALSGEIQGKASLPVMGSDHVECPYQLPKLSELESCQAVRFDHMAKRMLFFTSRSYVLVVSFDDAGYTAQKAAFEDEYTFCPPEQDDVMSGYTCSMDGFDIRAVEGGWYPKEMLFLGFNDQTREIAIVYYGNQDLDYIDEPLGKFLTEETGWNNLIP